MFICFLFAFLFDEQEILQTQHAQSLIDLRCARQNVEDMRNTCFQEKESFFAKCIEVREVDITCLSFIQ